MRTRWMLAALAAFSLAGRAPAGACADAMTAAESAATEGAVLRAGAETVTGAGTCLGKGPHALGAGGREGLLLHRGAGTSWAIGGREERDACRAAAAQEAIAGQDVASRQNERAGSREILLSLALPGLGELRTGHRNRAILHFAAEAAAWVSFVVFRVQGELRKDDYIEYAHFYAGVQDPEGRSDDYYKELAKYMRSDPGPNSYNEREVRATARALYPDDPEARRRYIDENEITGGSAWSWESEEAWFTFISMRESSELSFQRSRFAIAAAIANRIASVLGLTRTRVPGGSKLEVGVTPLAQGRPAATIALSKSF